MEKKKAVKMLIARYTADAAALEKRERDLIKQMEAIENLIPTVTIAYVSKVTQSSDMSLPQSHVKEAKERLEHLKRSLKEVQQSIEMVREEGIVMNKRIKELETSLCDELNEYSPTTDNNVDNENDVQSFRSSDVVEKVDPKINGVKRQSGTRFLPAKDTDSKQYRGRNVATDKTKPDKLGTSYSVADNIRKKEKDNLEVNKVLEDKKLKFGKSTRPNELQDEDTDFERYHDTNIVQAQRMPKPGKTRASNLEHPETNIDQAQHKPKPDKTHSSDVGILNLDRKIGKLNMLETNKAKPTTKPDTSLEQRPDRNIVQAKRMPKPVNSVFRMAPDSRIAPYLRDEKYEQEIENYKHDGLEDKRVKLTQGADLKNDSDKKIGRASTSTRDKPDNLRKSSQGEHLKDLLHGKDTDWKQVYDNLSHKVDKLNEHLESSTKKLEESESYVKNLEEECSKLEKELQRKIQLMSLTTFKMVEGEGITPAYMQLAHWRFALKLPEYQGDRELKEKLFNGIKQGNMAPYYKEVCADLGWEFDSKLYDEMSAANVKRLEELEKEHENNVMDEEDQSQLCGVWQSKLDYLCSIGDRENATTLANSKVDDKTVPKSHRIDAVFSLFRISFFHGCNVKGMSTAIEKATELIEGISGGDWSARNKLKAYEGVWSLAIRDFTRAAHLFVDVVPTFESYELADFGTIIRYTVLSCMIALPRCDLRKKLMLHGVMAQALHSQYQDLREYFVSLYDGRYSDFLVCLARIEVEMKRDPLLHPHYRHYVQEMRLRAYKQILQAYRSLSLDYMAQSFGVTSEFIEREVARFAAAGRLQCKIDSVAGTVITSAHLDDSVRSKEAPEASQDRNILYQTTVKRGDILLNRLKKLARVMDF